VGIYGVDTREPTRILREEGSMTAKIVSELPEDGKIEYFAIHDAVQAVSDGKMDV
jgi:carbamoylphosphate synthase small subunit